MLSLVPSYRDILVFLSDIVSFAVLEAFLNILQHCVVLVLALFNPRYQSPSSFKHDDTIVLQKKCSKEAVGDGSLTANVPKRASFASKETAERCVLW